MKIPVIIDFEAVSNPFKTYLGLGKAKDSELFFCYSIAFKTKEGTGGWTNHFYIPQISWINNPLHLGRMILKDIFRYIKNKIGAKSWKEINNNIQFYGWNPELENHFFESFDETKNLIKVKNVYSHDELISLDKLFDHSSFDKSFFQTKVNFLKSKNLYDKNSWRQQNGFTAAEYGYFYIYHHRKINARSVRDYYKYSKNLEEGTLKNELSEYSKYDVIKASFIYDHINEFQTFLADYKVVKQKLKKELGDYRASIHLKEYRNLYSVMKLFFKNNPYSNKDKYSLEECYQLIQEHVKDKEQPLKEYMDFLTNNPIKKLNCKNMTYEELKNKIIEAQQLWTNKCTEIQNVRRQIIRSFYTKYIDKK